MKEKFQDLFEKSNMQTIIAYGDHESFISK